MSYNDDPETREHLFSPFWKWAFHCHDRYKNELRVSESGFLKRVAEKRVWLMYDYATRYRLEATSVGYYIDLHIPLILANECETLYDVYERNLQPESMYMYPLLWENLSDYEDIMTALWFGNDAYFEKHRNLKKLLDRGFFTLVNIKDSNKTLTTAMSAEPASIEYEMARHLIGLSYLDGYSGSTVIRTPTERIFFYSNDLSAISKTFVQTKTREIVCKFIMEVTKSCMGLLFVIQSIPQMHRLLTYLPLHTVAATKLKQAMTSDGKRHKKSVVLQKCCQYVNDYLDLISHLTRDQQWLRTIHFTSGNTVAPVRKMVPFKIKTIIRDPSRFNCLCGCDKTVSIEELYIIATKYRCSVGFSYHMLKEMRLSEFIIDQLRKPDMNSGMFFCSWVNAIIFIVCDVRQNHKPSFALDLCGPIRDAHKSIDAKREHVISVCNICNLWQCIILNAGEQFSASHTDGVIIDSGPCTNAFPTLYELQTRSPNSYRRPTIACGVCHSGTTNVDMVGCLLYGKGDIAEEIRPVMKCCGCGNITELEKMICSGQLVYCKECIPVSSVQCICGDIPSTKKNPIITVDSNNILVNVYYLCVRCHYKHCSMSIIRHLKTFPM